MRGGYERMCFCKICHLTQFWHFYRIKRTPLYYLWKAISWFRMKWAVMWVFVSLCWNKPAQLWWWWEVSPQFVQTGNQCPSDFSLPPNPTRTVRSTFDPTPHTGATSFITWMWSVVIGGVGRKRGFGVIRTLEWKGGFYVHVQRVQTERDAVWYDSDWLGWGVQRGQGVRADECFVIL